MSGPGNRPIVNSSNRQIANLPNRSMFWRMWWRSLTIKRPQAGLAIASLMVGAAVASMLLNLYGDVRRKMTQEFRAYGPNVILAPAETSGAKFENDSGAGPLAGVMDEAATSRLAPILARTQGAAAVPVLYAVAELKRLPPDPRLPEFQNLVAVGTDFSALRRLYPSWRITGSEAGGKDSGAVIGARVAGVLHLRPGDSFRLQTPGTPQDSEAQANGHWTVSGVVSSGSSEDDQVFIPLASLQKLAGLEGKISLIQLSLPGDAAEIERVEANFGSAAPGIEAHPVRQIVYSSGKVLGTIRWLTISLTALIVIIIALSVTATMTAIVLERRKDVAVMKALGASDRLVMELFLSEGASLGLLGAVIGFVMGVILARGMAARLFAVGLSPAWWTLPAVALGGTALAVVATLLPVKLVRGVQPATVLKGE
jgi:putative ABC transport system permease protein